MGLSLVGLSHKTAPISLREDLSFPPQEIAAILHAERDRDPRELVILSTCNRTEIYSYTVGEDSWALKFLTQNFGGQDISPYIYEKKGIDAVRQLFRVASGLDSLVIGETEILKQVKDAYQLSNKMGLSGKIFNVLFQRALYVGKFVRTHTAVGQGPLSVGSVAVSLAEKIFGDLRESTVLLFGAGKIATVSSRTILSKKVKRLYVANRTLSAAQELAMELGAAALSLEKGMETLSHTDIVLTSVSVSQYLLTREIISKAMSSRHNRSLFMIDISVPRSIDPAVHKMDNVYLYNIDDLQGIVQENGAKREREVEIATKIVEEKSAEFFRWLSSTASGEQASLKHSA